MMMAREKSAWETLITCSTLRDLFLNLLHCHSQRSSTVYHSKYSLLSEAATAIPSTGHVAFNIESMVVAFNSKLASFEVMSDMDESVAGSYKDVIY